MQITFEVTQEVSGTCGATMLAKGQVVTAELISRGTNWIKVKLPPRGPMKTLFNFEIKIRSK